MEICTSTLDVREAAAFGTLGVVIRPKKVLDERSGRRLVRFYLGLDSVDRAYNTKRLQAELKKGTLPAGHPLRVILWGMENRRLLLDLSKQGKGLRLVEAVPGLVWHYVEAPGVGLPGLVRGEQYFKTGDLKLVAALALGGLPVVRIDGEEHRRNYYLPMRGPARGALGPANAREIAEAWRRDKEELPWEDPIAQGLRGLHNRERLLNVVDGMAGVVLLRRNVRKVTLREDASDAAWEKAERFLG